MMGAGRHGGFGKTHGAGLKVVSASSTFVGKGKGEELKKASKWVVEEPGYTDVIIHGKSDTAQIMHNGKWVDIDQRRLATMLNKDSGYTKGNIRLLSCEAGKLDKGFAQNLANKLGVSVKAPTDTLWIFSNGAIKIGPTKYKNTGTWRIFTPQTKGGHK